MEIFDNSLTEQIEIRMIHPSRHPIRYSDLKTSPEFINLKASIKDHGLLQPIVIRPLEHGFEIVAGHRRFAACRSLRWRSIMCKIKEITDKQAYEIQLTENIQRKSMDPLEEAEAYQRYVLDFGWGGVGDLAEKIGKSAEYVSHRMQLLKLPKNIQEKILTNKLSVSQALEISSIDSPSAEEIANEIVNNKLTIRQIRKIKNDIVKKNEQLDNKKDEKLKELHIIKKSTLTLKITLSRIDDLIEDAHKVSCSDRTNMINYLMDLRRQTHSMIDKSIIHKKQYLK